MPVVFIADITHAIVDAEASIHYAVRSREVHEEDEPQAAGLKEDLIKVMKRQLPILTLAAVDQVCMNANLPTTSSLIDHVAGHDDTYWHQFMRIDQIDAMARAYQALRGLESVRIGSNAHPWHAPELDLNSFEFLSAWPGRVLGDIFLKLVAAVRMCLAAHGLHNWCIGASDTDPAIDNVLELTHCNMCYGYLGASLIPMTNEPASFLQR